MERWFCSLLVVMGMAAFAAPPSSKLAQCNDQLADCRENCTIDYGTSFKLRSKLNRCVKKCVKKVKSCRSRTIELEQAGITLPEDEAAEKKKAARQQASPALTPEPAREREPEPVVKERREEPGPKVSEEPAREKPVKQVKAKPAREEPEQPAAAPKKKQKDLDEWDDGDIDY